MAHLTIDSHHHFWELSRFDYDWMPEGDNVLRQDYLPKDLEPILGSNQIDKTVLVQAHESLEEATWFLDLASSNDFIAGVVAWVDLVDPMVGNVLDDLMKHKKFVGVRHGVEHDPDQAWLTRDASIRGLEQLAARGIPYDVLTRPHQLKYIPQLADKIPDLKMVIDHISKPPIASGDLEPWASEISKVSEIPGIFCKVSGMVTEADPKSWEPVLLRPYVSHILEIFGVDRLMFGSDWPVCLLASSYEGVVAAAQESVGNLGSEDKTKFMGGNAIDFYELDV